MRWFGLPKCLSNPIPDARSIYTGENLDQIFAAWFLHLNGVTDLSLLESLDWTPIAPGKDNNSETFNLFLHITSKLSLYA